MKKIIRLTESDLTKMIKKVLSEARVSDCVQNGDGLCSIVCGTKVASKGCPPSREVKQIQNALAKGGFFEGTGGGMSKDCANNIEACDGIFDKRTKEAVEQFQKWKGGLTQDGIVGSLTLEALVNSKLLMNLKCNCDEIIKTSDKTTLIVDKENWYKGLPNVESTEGFSNCDNIKHCLGLAVQYVYIDKKYKDSQFAGILSECLSSNKFTKDKNKKSDCPDYLDCMPKTGKTNPFCKDIKSFMKMCPTTKITY